MNKTRPIYKVGDVLYYRKKDMAFEVTKISVIEEGLILYFSDANHAYAEYDLIPMYDFLRANMEEGKARINVGFDRDDNPEIIQIEPDRVVFKGDMSLKKLIQQFDGAITKDVMIEGFELPMSCMECPMVGIEYQDDNVLVRLHCVLLKNPLEENILECYYVRRSDCPLRTISRESFTK